MKKSSGWDSQSVLSRASRTTSADALFFPDLVDDHIGNKFVDMLYVAGTKSDGTGRRMALWQKRAQDELRVPEGEDPAAKEGWGGLPVMSRWEFLSTVIAPIIFLANLVIIGYCMTYIWFRMFP
mmetsp:Transcript_11401/g.25521  ORF Transcript_11401/g.25521 Transcript_11401/m.25521 type:complete len:124 (-) Transcript_11401:226-597(-)